MSDQEETSAAFDWLEEYGDRLFAYALPRVGDRSVAEDLVQEALLGALGGSKQFKGQSSVETWLIGILRRKIYDYYRRAYRRAETSLDAWEGWEEDLGAVAAWAPDAATACEDREFREVFDQCLGRLSPPLAAAFVACVLDELTTQEACKLLDVTPTNLSVRLHRARLSLRACLQQRWFGGDSG